MTNFSIKPATVSDIDDINQLIYRSKAYWGYSDSFMSDFMKLFAVAEAYIKKYNMMLMINKIQTLGLYSFKLNHEHLLELDYFFVNVQCIGKGFGRRLWNSAVDHSTQYHKKKFIIWSDPGAQGFYEKMGCVEIGKRNSPLITGRTAPIMAYVYNNT